MCEDIRSLHTQGCDKGNENNMKRLTACTILLIWIALYSLSAAAVPALVRSPLYTSVDTASLDFVFDRSIEKQLGYTVDESTALAGGTGGETLAMSHPDYPVTPGDILQIEYVDANSPVSILSQVNSSYVVPLNAFGEIDAQGMSYEEVKELIATSIENYLPFSNPAVSLVSAGTFFVTITGEVDSTVHISSWGLSRLSSTIPYASDFASTRDVSVTSLDGSVTHYDLYKALREGELDQDPLLKRGDVVRYERSENIIMIAGEVKRPGVYQITGDTSIAQAIEEYAHGPLPTAGDDGYSLRRYESGKVTVSHMNAADAGTMMLTDYDTLYVPPVTPSSKAVTIEGAVTVGDTPADPGTIQSSGRLYYQFYPGETVTQMVQNLSDKFSAVSDLENMYVKRDGKIFPVNVRDILLGENDTNGALTLKEGDVFVVPFSQLFVHVAGGVVSPGTYPYIPDKNGMYYINLAGGFDPSKNRNGKFTILDKYGERQESDSIITPESVVTAKLNTFQAVNGANLATTVTITGLVATVLAIIIDATSLLN